MGTYQCDPCVENLKKVGKVRQLEGRQPAMRIELDIILKDHGKGDKKIGGSDTSENNQGLLADSNPWRMANTKKDRLSTVSRA